MPCLMICFLFRVFSPQKIGHKRVLLFTNTDNPHATDRTKQVYVVTLLLLLNCPTPPSISFFLFLSIYLSACLSVCLSICLSIFRFFLSYGVSVTESCFVKATTPCWKLPGGPYSSFTHIMDVLHCSSGQPPAITCLHNNIGLYSNSLCCSKCTSLVCVRACVCVALI